MRIGIMVALKQLPVSLVALLLLLATGLGAWLGLASLTNCQSDSEMTQLMASSLSKAADC
jgi:hypothetical protein